MSSAGTPAAEPRPDIATSVYPAARILARRHRPQWWEAIPWILALAFYFAFPDYLGFGVELLVTWNCRHIANPVLRPRAEAVCRAAGYEPPAICTPAELLGGADDGGG